MDLTTSLLNYLRRKGTPQETKAPKGLCPNCWGHEEYGGHFYTRVQQENWDINSKNSNVGWVSAYANKHLAGIVLKRQGDGESFVCENCKTSYKHDDEHTTS